MFFTSFFLMEKRGIVTFSFLEMSWILGYLGIFLFGALLGLGRGSVALGRGGARPGGGGARRGGEARAARRVLGLSQRRLHGRGLGPGLGLNGFRSSRNGVLFLKIARGDRAGRGGCSTVRSLGLVHGRAGARHAARARHAGRHWELTAVELSRHPGGGGVRPRGLTPTGAGEAKFSPTTCGAVP